MKIKLKNKVLDDAILSILSAGKNYFENGDFNMANIFLKTATNLAVKNYFFKDEKDKFINLIDRNTYAKTVFSFYTPKLKFENKVKLAHMIYKNK